MRASGPARLAPRLPPPAPHPPPAPPPRRSSRRGAPPAVRMMASASAPPRRARAAPRALLLRRLSEGPLRRARPRRVQARGRERGRAGDVPGVPAAQARVRRRAVPAAVRVRGHHVRHPHAHGPRRRRGILRRHETAHLPPAADPRPPRRARPRLRGVHGRHARARRLGHAPPNGRDEASQRRGTIIVSLGRRRRRRRRRTRSPERRRPKRARPRRRRRGGERTPNSRTPSSPRVVRGTPDRQNARRPRVSNHPPRPLAGLRRVQPQGEAFGRI